MRKFVLPAACALLMLSGCSLILTDAAFKERIRETVREDPSVVMEALSTDKVGLLEMVEQGAQERRLLAMREQWRKDAMTPLSPVVDETRPMKGAADAPVTVVAYTDFQCGYCARGSVVIDQIIADEPGRIRYFAKHAPMSEIGEYAARVFEAVGMQSTEQAWAFYQQAFADQGRLGGAEDPKTAYLDLAKGLPGIDAAKLENDVESEATRARVTGDASEFMQWGFRGVPVYLYNGVPVEGALPRQALDELLDIVDPKSGDVSQVEDGYSLDEAGLCSDCMEK